MRKIGELKGKPIIEGNPNEIKNNQIHAKTEGGGITLSERKNGSLETISGGNSGNASGDSEVQYYKVVQDNTILEEDGTTAYELFRVAFNHIVQYITIINFKLLEDSKLMSNVFYYTSSQEFSSDYTISELVSYIMDAKVSGICVYAGKTGLDFKRDNEHYEIEFKNNISDTVYNYLLSATDGSPTPEVIAEIKLFAIVLDKCLIPISKEEYYNL